MGVSASDLRALPEGTTKGEEDDTGRILREHQIPPEVCHPLAERTASGEAATTTSPARAELQSGDFGRAASGVGGRRISANLAYLDDLRPGFLTVRFRKCGKANCHCAQKGSPGHGPSYSLTHRVAGKTITQVIPQGPAIERTKAQIAEYRRFRQLVRELIAVSEQICSAKLRQAPTVTTTEAKKKPLRRSTGPRHRSGN